MTEGNEKKKTKSVGISTYARVRCFFADRESLRRAVIAKSKKECGGPKGTLTTLASEEESVRSMTTQFTDVIGENGTNEQTYKIICEPLIDKVLQGFKAILIAYGQTGSGKTFSLIGAKGPGQLGLLPRTCKTLIGSDKVIKLQLKAFEAYSTSLTKIILYDLFDECNKFSFEPFTPKSQDKDENKAAECKWVQRKSQAAQALWNTKAGRTGVNTMKEGHIREMTSVEDSFHLIEEAHDASHFAKTGKNPESSRGHTVYIVLVQMKNPKGEDYSPIQTEFVVVDLAGSEGGSTLEKLPDGMEKTVRFLEGGVINYGLTSLKDMFTEMRKKGHLKKSQGNGLRKLLYPFMTTNTMMSIIFTLSPSWDNVMPTRATMKFAQDACRLKMKPVADTGNKNWQKLYEKLKEAMAKKDEVIEDLQEQIQEGIEHTKAAAAAGSDSLGEVLGHIYQEQQDKVVGLFNDYELMEFVDEAIQDEVDGELKKHKENYYELLRKVFEEHSPDRLDDIEDMMEDWIVRGVGLRNGYEFICDMYDVVPKKEESARRVTRGLSVNRAAANQNRRKTAMWVESAQIMQTKLNAHLGAMDDELMEEEQEFFGVKITDLDECYDDGVTITPGIADADFEHIAEDIHHNVVFEDIDLSHPPDFWEGFSEEDKERIEAMFDDENNIEKGKLKYKFVKRITAELKITRHQLNELRDFLMVKKGRAHAHNLVQEFRNEVGAHDDHHHEAMELDENLQLIIEMKQQIHQLENDARVQKSLKLWGQMRLKIRDRKLKEKESEMHILEDDLRKKDSRIHALQEDIEHVHKADHALIESIHDKIEHGGVGSSDKIQEQLRTIMNAVTITGGGAGAGGLPDEKLEDELREAKNTIAVQEEKIEHFESITHAIHDKHMEKLVKDMGVLQGKYSNARISNHRLEGRLMEIRRVLNEQARKVEALSQQIFIILQFPKVITVSGREGYNDKINGTYRVGEHLHAGRVFYKNQDNLWALRWHPGKGLWIFDHRGLQHDDFGSACVECDVQHPLLVNKHWIVYGGDKDGFVVDEHVRITGVETHIHEHDHGSKKRNPGKKIVVMKKGF